MQTPREFFNALPPGVCGRYIGLTRNRGGDMRENMPLAIGLCWYLGGVMIPRPKRDPYNRVLVGDKNPFNSRNWYSWLRTTSAEKNAMAAMHEMRNAYAREMYVGPE